MANDPQHEMVGMQSVMIVVDERGRPIPHKMIVTHYDPAADNGEGAITGCIIETPVAASDNGNLLFSRDFSYTYVPMCGHSNCGQTFPPMNLN